MRPNIHGIKRSCALIPSFVQGRCRDGTAEWGKKVPSGLAPPPLADAGRPGHMTGPHSWADRMRCIGCGSAAVTERPERTAQGYRRFRCRSCGKQFNERKIGVLNRTQYPSDVIALVVLW